MNRHAPSTAKIMYVEDNADTRELVLYVLARAGYEVVVAENYKQAARLAQTTSFDLYLIDNCMPGGSGIELSYCLRKFDNDTPILFYCGAAFVDTGSLIVMEGVKISPW